MLKRFGVSLEEDLLKDFDELIKSKNYSNRSEAIRDLIRDALIKEEWEAGDKETAGVAILVYDHHQHELAKKLVDIQHKSYSKIISTLHTHLDEHNCLEAILVKGKAQELRQLANNLISARGVKHGQFVGTTTGEKLY
jgi:CopG family nickel-responsive transcriptional regulator